LKGTAQQLDIEEGEEGDHGNDEEPAGPSHGHLTVEFKLDYSRVLELNFEGKIGSVALKKVAFRFITSLALYNQRLQFF
jgi:hypothetical protein